MSTIYLRIIITVFIKGFIDTLFSILRFYKVFLTFWAYIFCEILKTIGNLLTDSLTRITLYKIRLFTEKTGIYRIINITIVYCLNNIQTFSCIRINHFVLFTEETFLIDIKKLTTLNFNFFTFIILIKELRFGDVTE